MKRIQYKRKCKRVLESIPIPISTEVYKVIIYFNNFKIINSSSSTVYTEKCGSVRSCKARARRVLLRMGAAIEDEIRKRS